MNILKLLVFSFFVLSGCEDLPFTDEDIHSEAPRPKVTKEETKEVDSFDTEILSPKHQRETFITIEERETVTDTTEAENSKTLIVKEIS